MRVLIADSEMLNRSYLKRMLEKLGHESVECEDGQQAMDILVTEKAPPIAILDWNLPMVSGPELCKKLRALPQGENLHIILITSKTNKAEISEGTASGADDYILKPFNKDELKVRVDLGLKIHSLKKSVEMEKLRTFKALKLTSLSALALSAQSTETKINVMKVQDLVQKTLHFCETEIFKEPINVKLSSRMPSVEIEEIGNSLSQVVLALILHFVESSRWDKQNSIEIHINERPECVELAFKESTSNNIVELNRSIFTDFMAPNSDTISLAKSVLEKNGGEIIRVESNSFHHYVVRIPRAGVTTLKNAA